ncbi:hypothetical protein DPEC_G00346400 [Dallia pectoralis]|uniref:Uncharacterized protein n=1 Tax=Dallia pectoralis TaxID=75939 RepID=A0ACC2F3T2_DALPE|nr:hypothetical protein DPEC_G00346400 [Dallia pectoralis]
MGPLRDITASVETVRPGGRGGSGGAGPMISEENAAVSVSERGYPLQPLLGPLFLSAAWDSCVSAAVKPSTSPCRHSNPCKAPCPGGTSDPRLPPSSSGLFSSPACISRISNLSSDSLGVSYHSAPTLVSLYQDVQAGIKYAAFVHSESV